MRLRPANIGKQIAALRRTDYPLRPASLWRRVAAGTIDLIVATYVIGYLLAARVGQTSGLGFYLWTNSQLWAWLLLWLAYFIIVEALFGATPGKMLLGLRVVGQRGSHLTWGASTVRNLLRLLDGAPFFVPYVLGFVAVIASNKRQRFGDQLAKTLVLEIDRSASIVQVSITPDRPASVCGDLVLATVVATFLSDAEVKEARVRLIGRQYIRSDTGSEPNRADDAKLGRTGHVPAGTRWEHTFQFRLPPDAPPSGAGPSINVEWMVSVSIDLARAPDANVDYPIQVLSPKRRPNASLDRSVRGTLDECPMDLVIHDRDVGAGETVKATLRVMPMQDLHLTSVEAYLLLTETYDPPRGTICEYRETEFGRMRLAQEVQVPAGQVAEFPIEIPLAYDLVPSRSGPYSETTWKLTAVAHRRHLSDLHVAAFLNVYNENLIVIPPGPSPSAGTRRRTRSSRR